MSQSDSSNIELIAVNMVENILCDPYSQGQLFKLQLNKTDKGLADDGYIQIVDHGNSDNSKASYRLMCQVKGKNDANITGDKIDNWLWNNNDEKFSSSKPVPLWHLPLYASYTEGFIFIVAYWVNGDKEKFVIFYEWKSREDWLKIFNEEKAEWERKGKQKKFEDLEYTIYFNSRNKITNDRQSFYNIIFPQVKAAYESYSDPNVIKLVEINRQKIQNTEENILKKQAVESSIKGLYEAFKKIEKKIDKIQISTRLIEILAEENQIKFTKQIISEASSIDLNETFRVLTSIINEHSPFWFKFIKDIVTRFDLKQETLDPETNYYNQRGIDWINAKFAFLNWLKEFYLIATEDQKREVEQFVTDLINKTTYNPLKNSCILAIQQNFEGLPDNLQKTIVKLAESDSYVKVTASDFLVKANQSEQYIKSSRKNVLSFIKALLKGKPMKAEYVNTDLMSSWRGEKYDLEHIGDNIYKILSQSIPTTYIENDLWLEIVLLGFLRDYDFSSDLFLDNFEPNRNLKVIKSKNVVLNGYKEDNFTFGFNESDIKQDITKQEGRYRWFTLLKQYILNLPQIERDIFIEKLLSEKIYKREGVYFTVFKTYHDQKWEQLKTLKLFLKAYSDWQKEKNKLEDYSIEHEWSRDWIGYKMNKGGHFVQTNEIEELIKNGGSKWENYLGFSLDEWQDKLYDCLINGLKIYGFESEERAVPIMLENMAKEKPDLAIQLLDICDIWLSKPPLCIQEGQNNSVIIFRWIYNLVYGIVQSNLDDERKFQFSINLVEKQYFKKDLVARVVNYWEKLLGNDGVRGGQLIVLKNMLIKLVSNYNDPQHDQKRWTSNRENNSGYELISLLINTNIGLIWILLGLKIYQKVPDFQTEIGNIMLQEFSKKDYLGCSAILYCFMYNGITDEMWAKDGLVYNIISKTLNESNILSDGRAELTLSIFNRAKSMAYNPLYKTNLVELVKQLFKYEKIEKENISLEIINHLNVYYGIFETIYSDYLDKSIVLKSKLLHIFASHAEGYRYEIERNETLDRPNIPNPVKAKQRLKNNFSLLLEWQNSYFRENLQVVGQEAKTVTTASFNKFFDTLEKAQNIEEVERFYNFWGEEILEKVLNTPYQYFIRIYGNESFFDNLIRLNSLETDNILENLLGMLCKNEFFMLTDSYSMKPIISSFEYLINKLDKKQLETSTIKDSLEGLCEKQKNNNEIIKLVDAFGKKTQH